MSSSAPSFSPAYVGASSVGSVMLRNGTSAQTFEVALSGDFTSSASGAHSLAESQSLQIPLTFAPSAAGARTGELSVTYGSETLALALEGTGLEPVAPSIQGGTSSVGFGELAVGSSLSVPLAVENPTRDDNPDDEPCTITVSIAGSAYTVTPSGSQTIAEGSSLALSVTFAPSAAQSYSATLSITWSRAGLSGTIEVALTGVGVESSAADASIVAGGDAQGGTVASGTRQRGGWYVPTYESYVSLGQAWTPESLTTTQPGFTASTTRHVFMRAAGSVTFQAENGPTWFQSEEGPLYMVSGAGSYMVAVSTLYVGGGGYVGIMAGYAGEPIPEDEVDRYDDDDPSRPAPVDDIPPAFFAADLVWQITDKLIGIATSAKLVEHIVYLGKHKSALGGLAIGLSTTAQAVGMTSYIYGKATGAPEKTLNFYSQAGILAGTPAFCSIYGGLGVNYRSANITLLGNIAVAVNSIIATTLDSLYGDTAVASAAVNATSWGSTSLYATLGQVSVLGRSVKLGGVLPDGMQLPTAKLELSSLATIAIDAGGGVPPDVAVSMKARSNDVWPDPLGKLVVHSTEAATFEAPKTTIRLNTAPGVVAWTIEATPAGVTIKNATGEVLSLKDGLITIGPTGGQIQLAAASTNVGGGSMIISDAQLAVSGFGDLL